MSTKPVLDLETLGVSYGVQYYFLYVVVNFPKITYLKVFLFCSPAMAINHGVESLLSAFNTFNTASSVHLTLGLMIHVDIFLCLYNGYFETTSLIVVIWVFDFCEEQLKLAYKFQSISALFGLFEIHFIIYFVFNSVYMTSHKLIM